MGGPGTQFGDGAQRGLGLELELVEADGSVVDGVIDLVLLECVKTVGAVGATCRPGVFHKSGDVAGPFSRLSVV